ncbi:MAG: hypothetical protein JSV88_19685 [Candidatus Aminicenantes bacterium]|nr:MAG: hypothetical protein JSV88_19685 [Candidatus Aminicenantes bacterium]
MNEVKCHPFNWDGLLKRIKQGNVIPVIGHQLYRDKNEIGKIHLMSVPLTPLHLAAI